MEIIGYSRPSRFVSGETTHSTFTRRASWAPERVWTFWTIGNPSAPARNQTLVCPNRSLVTIVASRNSKTTESRYVPRLIRITAVCVHMRDCPTDPEYCRNIVSNCDMKHMKTLRHVNNIFLFSGRFGPFKNPLCLL